MTTSESFSTCGMGTSSTLTLKSPRSTTAFMVELMMSLANTNILRQIERSRSTEIRFCAVINGSDAEPSGSLRERRPTGFYRAGRARHLGVGRLVSDSDSVFYLWLVRVDVRTYVLLLFQTLFKPHTPTEI